MAVPQQPLNVTLVDCVPRQGVPGTKVDVRISAPFGLSMIVPSPFFYLCFGHEKSPATVVRTSQDAGNCVLTVTATAPLQQTPSGEVALLLLIENATSDEPMEPMARVDAGLFMYQVVGVGGGGASPEADVTGGGKTVSPATRGHPTSTLKLETASLGPAPDAGTNTYTYPAAAAAAAASAGAAAVAQSNQDAAAAAAAFAAAAFPDTSNSDPAMIGTYRSSSFGDPFARSAVPSALRSPTFAWPHYEASSSRGHVQIVRPARIASGPGSAHPAPAFVRTSTIGSQGSSGLPFGSYQPRVVLKLNGDLESMTQNWTEEEYAARRRLVHFTKKTVDHTITVSFRPVSQHDRPANSILVSCILWVEKNEYYVTSVDLIHLLEQLVASPHRFSVEEKNRIRRNLEGFRPLTVSKAKADSEEFFKVIMGFPNPKPRNIEKDVKVYPWRVLGPALKKITSKYSTSPSAPLTPASSSLHAHGHSHPHSGSSLSHHHSRHNSVDSHSYHSRHSYHSMLPGSAPSSASLASPYPPLPPTTMSAAADYSPATLALAGIVQAHDSLSSPRTSLPGSATMMPQTSSSWGYGPGPSSRTMSPVSSAHLRQQHPSSPQHSSSHIARLAGSPLPLPQSSLPGAATYEASLRGTPTTSNYDRSPGLYGLAPPPLSSLTSPLSSGVTPVSSSRWDSTTTTGTLMTGYPGVSSAPGGESTPTSAGSYAGGAGAAGSHHGTSSHHHHHHSHHGGSHHSSYGGGTSAGGTGDYIDHGHRV